MSKEAFTWSKCNFTLNEAAFELVTEFTIFATLPRGIDITHTDVSIVYNACQAIFVIKLFLFWWLFHQKILLAFANADLMNAKTVLRKRILTLLWLIKFWKDLESEKNTWHIAIRRSTHIKQGSPCRQLF